MLSQDQMNLFYMSDSLFQHLLNTQSRELVIHSLVNILKDHYLNHVTAHTSFTTGTYDYQITWNINTQADIQRNMLGYLLSLPKISPVLIDGK